MMEQFAGLHKKNGLFSDFSDQVIGEEILPLGKAQDVPKGNYLIRFQDRVDTFSVVMGGKFNVVHIYANGDYGIMGVLVPGDLAGLDLICTKSRISPYYVEATQGCRVVTFPADMILKPGMLREELRVLLHSRMVQHIADENIRKEYRLAILFQKSLRGRIMTFLTMQANKRKSATFSVPFTRDEMASYLCVNRSCLSHELSLMEQEGILKFRRNTFTLLGWDENETVY